MAVTALGDRAALFSAQRHNVQLRERLGDLSQEMSTGRPTDMVRHTGGDTAPLADLDRRLAQAESYGRAAGEAGTRLGAMQLALAEAQGARGTLAGVLIAATTGSGPTPTPATAPAGEAAFERVASALNAQVAGGSLFAGTATDGPALAPAQSMLAGLRAALAGAATAADVQAVLDGWFDDPAGGFATSGYQGNAGTLARPLDAGESVSLGIRADDPALRGLLKATATAALVPALGLPVGDAQLLLGRARDALLSLTEPLTTIQASLGIAEGRAEEAQARHAARATAFGIQRAGLAEVDAFETATNLEATRTQLETQYALTQRLQSLSLARAL